MQIVVVFKGTVNTVLTSSQNSVILPAGYYEKTTISTNISSLGGTVTYYHHVHSTSSSSEYVITSTASLTSDGLADSYISSTSGGCYTTPWYKHTSSTNYGAYCDNLYSYTSSDDDGHTVNDYHGNCNNCGRDLVSHWTAAWVKCRYCNSSTTTYDSNSSNGTLVGYAKSCNYTRGQVIKAVITY